MVVYFSTSRNYPRFLFRACSRLFYEWREVQPYPRDNMNAFSIVVCSMFDIANCSSHLTQPAFGCQTSVNLYVLVCTCSELELSSSMWTRRDQGSRQSALCVVGAGALAGRSVPSVLGRTSTVELHAALTAHAVLPGPSPAVPSRAPTVHRPSTAVPTQTAPSSCRSGVMSLNYTYIHIYTQIYTVPKIARTILRRYQLITCLIY